MNWPTVLLGDICNPKQHPILSGSEMTDTGFPVYGANGRIGFFKSYTHEKSVILVGCRGSCGKIHVTTPRSYANGNAMALDALDESRIDMSFLRHWLSFRGFADVISGTSQPQIVRGNIIRVDVPLPPLDQQTHIAAILDQLLRLREQRQLALRRIGELRSSMFITIIGDINKNKHNWKLRNLRDICDVVTGNTPPRSNSSYYGEGIEWIKSDNLDSEQKFATPAVEHLSDTGRKVARTAPPGSTLVTCIAGSPNSIGNAGFLDRQAAFNQQINALIPRSVHPRFLFEHVRHAKRLIQEQSTGGMKGLVSKSRLGDILFMVPPTSVQRAFSDQVERLLSVRSHMETHLARLNTLHASVQHRAFRGEL